MTFEPPRQSQQPSSAGGGEVVDIRSRAGYRPDLGALARQQVAAARRRLGLDRSEFAAVLASVLDWAPSAEMVDSWESSVTPPGDVVLAAGLVSQAAPVGAEEPPDSDLVAQLAGRRFLDLEAVYVTRSEFTSRLPPHELFDGATDVRAVGLSLNVLCQQYADDRLRSLIEAGGTVRCLFLDPAGEAIRAREREEGYSPGRLSSLNEINIQIMLQRVRQRLAPPDRERLVIATYDETIRFNIILVDHVVAVVQPYLPAARGVESPTFVIRRRDAMSGLFQQFEQVFDWLWARRTEL